MSKSNRSDRPVPDKIIDHGSGQPKIYQSGQIPFTEADHCHIQVHDRVVTLRQACDEGLVHKWQGGLSGCWHWSLLPVADGHADKVGTTEKRETIGGPITIRNN
jgi:hypothetical protein